MKSIICKYLNKNLFEKKLWDFKKDCYDQWKSNDTPDFEFYFRIYKIWTLSGAYYRIEVPDMYTSDKNLFRVMERAITHIHDNSARYYRLVETLHSKSLWKNL